MGCVYARYFTVLLFPETAMIGKDRKSLSVKRRSYALSISMHC